MPIQTDLRRAFALHERGDLPAAEAAYRAILARAPAQAEANLLLAGLLWRSARQSEALAPAQAACRARPQDPATHDLLGSVFQELNRPDDALHCFGNALRLRPGEPTVLRNRANTLLDEGRPLEALADYDAALRADPRSADARVNRALALRALGRVREAASALDPLEGEADAAFHLAQCRLLLGDARGWAGLEARRRQTGAVAGPPGVPEWRGEALSGRRLLVRAEGGFGDALQFARLAPLLAARGEEVVLEVPPELLGVLRTLPGVTVVPAEAGQGSAPDARDTDPGAGEGARPAADGAALWVPLSSLPLRLGLDAAPEPGSLPLLRPDPERAGRWRAWLDAAPTEDAAPSRPRRVGVCWRGTPGGPWLRRRDAVPLAAFAALFEAPAAFTVVQTTLDPAERAALARHPGVRIPDGIDHATFDDAAALLASLDLVVCADSTTAHLAGALGVPTLLLLPLAADWRWGEGAHTPWYPSLRLLRAQAPGDWAGVVERAGALLVPDG